MRKIILFFLITVLVACSTTTPRVHYYSLVLDSDIVSPDQGDVYQKQLILIDPVHLAAFLRQPGLVLQKGNNELITANYHRWAEPLDELIGELLRINLNNKSKRFHFEWSDNLINNYDAMHLKLFFNKFQATDHSEVVISGRYGLTDPNNDMQLLTEFSIEEIQTQDGYLNTVETLKKTLNKLAEEILLTLNKIKS